MRALAFTPASLVALCLSACQHVPQGPAAAHEQSSLALTERCTDPALGVSISYPKGWWTNGPEPVRAPCRYFHPTPFVLEAATESPPTAIELDDEPFSVEEIRASWDAGGSERLLSAEPVTVSGKRGYRAELEATEGAVTLPAGTRLYGYVLPLDAERTLVLFTTSLGEPPYEVRRAVLDAMAQTLTLP